MDFNKCADVSRQYSISNTINLLFISIILNGAILAKSTSQKSDETVALSNDLFSQSINVSVIRTEVSISIPDKSKVKPDELINKAVNTILNGNMQDSVKLLDDLSNDNCIYMIVQQVFIKNDYVNRFDSLIELANLTTNRNRAALIYIAMSKLLINTDNNDANLAKLMDLIIKQVINSKTVISNIRNEALYVLKSLNNKMKQYCLDFLKSLLIDNKIIDIEEGFSVINSIYQTDDKMMEDIYQDFLINYRLSGNNAYNEIFKKLEVLVTRYSSCSSQHLLLHVIDISFATSFDKINSIALAELCNKYKNLELTYQRKLSPRLLLKIRSKFKDFLPYSMYNAIFAEKVCVKNVGLNEYLSIWDKQDPYYIQDNYRRNVFTRSRNETDGYKEWKIEYKNSTFRFMNPNLNEYMYTSVKSFVNKRHIIWTWIPKDPVDYSMWWDLQEIGDFVYIRGDKSKEYLFGSSKADKYPDWMARHVYSLSQGDNVCPENDCVWVIEDCDHPYDPKSSC